MVPTAMEAFSVTRQGHRPVARSAIGTGRSLPKCLLASQWDNWHACCNDNPRG